MKLDREKVMSEALPKKSLTTCVLLNWNTLHVAKDSIRRLAREVPVIVVDNGSTDGSATYFADHPRENVEYLLLPKNQGNCVARNLALDKVTTPYFFLLDGDILYVPNSIKVLEAILEANEGCGCVGVSNNALIQRYGHNGTPYIGEADLKAETPDTIYRGFPMAWTQYGLFCNTGQRFIDTPPFDQPGYGYEDSYYYHEMKAKGLESYFIETPVYYHDAHSSRKEFAKLGLPDNEAARKAVFAAQFGDVDWLGKELTIEPV